MDEMVKHHRLSYIRKGNLQFAGVNKVKVVLYVHGKDGSASESRQYENLFDCAVVGLDYDDYTPWIAKDIILNKYKELERQYDVKSNSIDWKTNTSILYGEKDSLVSIETIRTFADTHNATLTVMPQGEHWFHTPEQLSFLMKWMKSRVES